MPRLKLDLDADTYGRLVEQAVAERRPVVWQAEVTIRRAVGLPFPHDAPDERPPAHASEGQHERP